MKPGEHPEFFRFPAPPGRTRESQIRLDANGQFWDHGEPVRHPRMQQAFARWIRRHPDDGRYVLSNGYDWTYFTVEGTPFFVTSARAGSGGLELTLSDGSSETLEGPLWQGAGGALYLRVKGGAYNARFQPAAQAGLTDWLLERDGQWSLRSGEVEVPILEQEPEYPSGDG